MVNKKGLGVDKILALREKIDTKAMQKTLLFFEIFLSLLLIIFGVMLKELWWICAIVLAFLIVVFLIIHLYIKGIKRTNLLPRPAIVYDGYKMFSLTTYQGKFNVFFDDIISITSKRSSLFFWTMSYGTLLIKTSHMTFKLKNISMVEATCDNLNFLVERNRF